MPKKIKKVDPEKLVKVDTYLRLVPTMGVKNFISKPTVYRHCRAGKLPHVYIDGVLHLILD